MITLIRNIQDSGKTASMVAAIRQHVLLDGYSPGEVYVNFGLKIDGAHCLNNKEMIAFLTKAMKSGIKHLIIGITEADRVFPARYWQKQDQTDALIGLWQDEKSFWLVYADAHSGTGVDVTMRSVRQIAWIPRYNKAKDLIKVHVINGCFAREYNLIIPNVSQTVFPYYDRWQVNN